MHIIFPIDQLQEWEAQGAGNAQLQSLICISKLDGPVEIVDDGKSVNVKENMQMFQDQFGAVHWAWGQVDEPDNIIQLPAHLRASLEEAVKRGVPMPNGLAPGEMDLTDNHQLPPEETGEDLRS